jgi:hypothetical protein
MKEGEETKILVNGAYTAETKTPIQQYADFARKERPRSAEIDWGQRSKIHKLTLLPRSKPAIHAGRIHVKGEYWTAKK